MKNYSVSVEVGYDLRTVSLTEDELRQVRSGLSLSKQTEDYYEGEIFTYLFKFNQDPEHSLTVTYAGGVGFVGRLEDAIVSEMNE